MRAGGSRDSWTEQAKLLRPCVRRRLASEHEAASRPTSTPTRHTGHCGRSNPHKKAAAEGACTLGSARQYFSHRNTPSGSQLLSSADEGASSPLQSLPPRALLRQQPENVSGAWLAAARRTQSLRQSVSSLISTWKALLTQPTRCNWRRLKRASTTSQHSGHSRGASAQARRWR